MYCLQTLALVALCALGIESASLPHHNQYHYKRGIAADGDSRSPCPALNALANHGILPRNGRAITPDQLTQSVEQVYNIDTILATLLGHGALPLIANNTLDALTKSTLDLSDLDKHDGIEHDASLSRNDASQGDNHSMQPTLLAALLADSTTDSLTIDSLAKSRARRELDASSRGLPKPGLKVNTLAYGEAALLLQALSKSSNVSEPVVPKAFVQAWIGEEKLPDGWVKPATQIGLSSTSGISSRIQSLAAALKGTKA